MAIHYLKIKEESLGKVIYLGEYSQIRERVVDRNNQSRMVLRGYRYKLHSLEGKSANGIVINVFNTTPLSIPKSVAVTLTDLVAVASSQAGSNNVISNLEFYATDIKAK